MIKTILKEDPGKATVGLYTLYPISAMGLTTVGVYGITPPVQTGKAIVGIYGEVIPPQFNSGRDGRFIISSKAGTVVNATIDARNITLPRTYTLQDFDGYFTLQSLSALTPTRLPFANASGLLTDDSELAYVGGLLTVTSISLTRLYVNDAIAAPTPVAGGTWTHHYGGLTNYLGDPNAWLRIVVGANTYKIPLYS